jgi:hypothetical protein
MRTTFPLLLLVAACGMPPSSAGARVRDADTPMVAACQYLGDVEGSSGWGNLMASTGMQSARNEARSRAGALGATHIVWNAVSGGYAPFATGRAYRCPT